MKNRNGFVSNSSASSFIVHHINWITRKITKNEKEPLNKKDIQKLLKFGFKETCLSHPSALDRSDDNDQSIWKAEVNEDGVILSKNFGYWVSCNENEVIQFLVKNDIGFIAMGHYGHVTYLFHKGDKYLMVFRNYGSEVETYHYNKKWEDIVKTWELYGGKPYERIPIKKILKW